MKIIMYKILIVFNFIICIACNIKDEKDLLDSSEKQKHTIIDKHNSKINKITDGHKDYFEVIKVDSLESLYVIYTKKKEVNYKIISERTVFSNNCKKIKKGDFLDLKLISIVPDTSKISYKISGVGYKGIEIEFEGDSILDIYETKNLKGLCWVKK